MEIMHKRLAERLADAVLDENTGLNKKKAVLFPRVNLMNIAASKGMLGLAMSSITGGNTGNLVIEPVAIEEDNLRKELVHGTLSKARYCSLDCFSCAEAECCAEVDWVWMRRTSATQRRPPTSKQTC